MTQEEIKKLLDEIYPKGLSATEINLKLKETGGSMDACQLRSLCTKEEIEKDTIEGKRNKLVYKSIKKEKNL